jgi:hypothetical protein
MEFQDKTLSCSDCGSPFTFTAGEQRFYQEKGFSNEPRRCKDCRTRKRGDGERGDRGGGGGVSRHAGPGRSYSSDSGAEKQYFNAVCSAWVRPSDVRLARPPGLLPHLLQRGRTSDPTGSHVTAKSGRSGEDESPHHLRRRCLRGGGPTSAPTN